MSKILDNSKTGLAIFSNPIDIDYGLPKWTYINSLKEKDELNEKTKNSESSTDGNPNMSMTLNDAIYLDDKLEKEKYSHLNISSDKLKKMNIKEFNIFLNEEGHERFLKSMGYGPSAYGKMTNYFIDSPNPVQIINKSKPSWFDRIKSRILGDKKENQKEEKIYSLNVLDFFNDVKSTLKDTDAYTRRIEPYMLAIVNAQNLGQTALVDKMLGEIFTIKYESILQTEGFQYRISEKQICDFVRKTEDGETGLHLDYVKNFMHPIPDEVAKKKAEADNLEVFDNYAILYYDKDDSSYGKTAAEQERERAKKNDPILFGLIGGSKNLYYIADWVDEYCDLTLEEFIKKSGLDEKAITMEDIIIK